MTDKTKRLRSYGYNIAVIAIAIMLVTAVPLSNIPLDDNIGSDNIGSDKAEGIVPVAVGAGVVGAGVGGYAGYEIGKYFSSGSEAIKEDVSGSIDNATNDTLRSSVHSNAIVSEGTNEAYLDNYENDLTTIEGQVEQQVAQRIIKESNNVTTKAGLINIAEDEASNYLNIRQDNAIQTHNFGSVSVNQYHNQLEQANASDDIYAKSPRTGTVSNADNTLNIHSNNVRDVEQLDNGKIVSGSGDSTVKIFDKQGNVDLNFSGHTDFLTDVEQLDNGKIVSASEDETVKIFDQQGNVDLTFSGHTNPVEDVEQLSDGRLVSASSDETVKIFDQQGNVDLTFSGHSKNVYDVEQLDNGKIVSGSGDSTVKIFDQQGNVDLTFSGHANAVEDVEQLSDGRLVSASGDKISGDNTVKIFDKQGNVDLTFSGHTDFLTDVEQLDNGKIVSASWDDTVKIFDKQGNVDLTFSGHTGFVYDVEQLDNGKIVSSSADETVKITSLFNQKAITFDPEDVSSTNLESSVDYENETYTGVNIPLSSSYSNKDAKVILPYVGNSGNYKPIEYNSGESLIIETTTSGVSERAEPLDYKRSIDTIKTNDNLADQVYQSVGSYAGSQWDQYISDIAGNESKDISDLNISKDLAQLTPVAPDPDNTEAVIANYVGLYEGTEMPTDDVITVEDGSSKYTGTLFSTDVSNLANETNNTDAFMANDTFDVSGTTTFIIDDNTGVKHDLDGNVTVTDISGKDKVQIRDYDLDRTDLKGQAERLVDQSEATQEVVDNPGEYVPPSVGGSGLPNNMLIIVAGLVVVVILLRD